MAVNNVNFDANGEPLLQAGETIARREADVRYEIEAGDGYPGSGANYYGKGSIVLTQYRLIILPTPRTPRLSSLTLPLACIAPADFTISKPLLSADYCSGKAVPTPNGGLPTLARFKLILGKNTDAFFKLAKQLATDAAAAVSSGNASAVAGHVTAMTQPSQTYRAPVVVPPEQRMLMQLGIPLAISMQPTPSQPIPTVEAKADAAFVDPSNPSIVYVNQPSAQQPTYAQLPQLPQQQQQQQQQLFAMKAGQLQYPQSAPAPGYPQQFPQPQQQQFAPVGTAVQAIPVMMYPSPADYKQPQLQPQNQFAQFPQQAQPVAQQVQPVSHQFSTTMHQQPQQQPQQQSTDSQSALTRVEGSPPGAAAAVATGPVLYEFPQSRSVDDNRSEGEQRAAPVVAASASCAASTAAVVLM